jgi:hypothetical protein
MGVLLSVRESGYPIGYSTCACPLRRLVRLPPSASETWLQQFSGRQDKGTPAAKELSAEELHKAAGGAAVDYFLKIDGVDGESSDDKHKKEIDVI